MTQDKAVTELFEISRAFEMGEITLSEWTEKCKTILSAVEK